MEHRDVAIADEPVAFISAYMDEEVFMMLAGPLSELTETVSLETYREYVLVGRKGQISLHKA